VRIEEVFAALEELRREMLLDEDELLQSIWCREHALPPEAFEQGRQFVKTTVVGMSIFLLRLFNLGETQSNEYHGGKR